MMLLRRVRSSTSQFALKQKLKISTNIPQFTNRSRLRLWAPNLFDSGIATAKRYDISKLSLSSVLVQSASSILATILSSDWLSRPSEDPSEREHFIIPAFEEGRGVDIYRYADRAIRVDVERPQEERGLAALLCPREVSTYAVVLGHVQCGKSTLVRKVIRSIEGPKGLVYCNVPVKTNNFIDCLRDVLGFNLAEMLPFERRSAKQFRQNRMTIDQQALWLDVRNHLFAAGKAYRAKHGRPIVLVVDSADLLAREQPQLLIAMQDFAKTCAEKGLLRIVFMSSDGSVVSLMQTRLSWPHFVELFEVGDISDRQAENLLMQEGIPRMVAKVAVEHITGGCFRSLQEFLQIYNPEEPVESLIRDLDMKMSRAMQHLNLLVQPDLFHDLLSRPAMHRHHQMHKLLQIAQIETLLEHNIIVLNPRGFYTFGSRQVAAFFRRQLASLRHETKSFINFLVACY